MRKIAKCMNCQEPREIVSHGLCAKCNQRGRRAADKRDEPVWASPDRSQQRYLAERNKMLGNLVRIIKLVDETPCLSPEDAQVIKTAIRPYMLERAESLAPKPEVNPLTQPPELTVNSEQKYARKGKTADPEKEFYKRWRAVKRATKFYAAMMDELLDDDDGDYEELRIQYPVGCHMFPAKTPYEGYDIPTTKAEFQQEYDAALAEFNAVEAERKVKWDKAAAALEDKKPVKKPVKHAKHPKHIGSSWCSVTLNQNNTAHQTRYSNCPYCIAAMAAGVLGMNPVTERGYLKRQLEQQRTDIARLIKWAEDKSDPSFLTGMARREEEIAELERKIAELKEVKTPEQAVILRKQWTEDLAARPEEYEETTATQGEKQNAIPAA